MKRAQLLHQAPKFQSETAKRRAVVRERPKSWVIPL